MSYSHYFFFIQVEFQDHVLNIIFINTYLCLTFEIVISINGLFDYWEFNIMFLVNLKFQQN